MAIALQPCRQRNFLSDHRAALPFLGPSWTAGGRQAQAQMNGASGKSSCTSARWKWRTLAAGCRSCGAAAKKLRYWSARAATSGQRAISSSESSSARASSTCVPPGITWPPPAKIGPSATATLFHPHRTATCSASSFDRRLEFLRQHRWSSWGGQFIVAGCKKLWPMWMSNGWTAC